MKGCGFSFYFIFYVSISMVFFFPLSFLHAVDAFCLLQFQTTWSYTDTEQTFGIAGPGAGAQAPLQGRDAQNGNCTSVDRKVHGCIQGLQGPRGLYVMGRQRGYKPFCTNACPPAHSSI